MKRTRCFIRMTAALLALMMTISIAPLGILAESPEQPKRDPAQAEASPEQAEESGETLLSQLTEDEENTLYREIQFALPDNVTEEEAKEITLPEKMMIADGTLLFAVPQAERERCTFSGWFYDAALKEPADGWDVIDRNITLYPSFAVIQDMDDDVKVKFISDLDVEPDFEIGIVAYNLTEDEIRKNLKVTNLNRVDDEEEFTLERIAPDLYTLIPDGDLRGRAMAVVKAYQEETLAGSLGESLRAITAENPEKEMTQEEVNEAILASGARTSEEEARARAPKPAPAPALAESVITELVFYYAPDELKDSEAIHVADLLRRAKEAGYDPKALTATQLAAIMTPEELADAGVTDPAAVTDNGNTMDLESKLRTYRDELPAVHYIVRPADGEWLRGYMHQVEILDTDSLRFFRNGQTTNKYVIYHNITVHQDNFSNIRFNDSLIYLPAGEVEGVELDCGLYRVEGTAADGLDLAENDDKGVLTYSGNRNLPVGATVVVYDGTIDVNGTSDGPVGYFRITEDLGGGRYAYEGPEYSDVIFVSDVIPVRDDGSFDDGELLITADQLVFSGEIYEKLKLDENTTVDFGDFLAVYSGSLDKPDSLAATGYGRVTSVAQAENGILVRYDIVDESAIRKSSAMHMEYDNIDIPVTEEELKTMAERLEEDVRQSGFAEQSAKYIEKLITMDGEAVLPDSEYGRAMKELKFERADGGEISLEEVRRLAGGQRVSIDWPPTFKFNPTLALQHFSGSGIRFEGAVVFKLNIEMNDGADLELKVVGLIELEIALGYTVDFDLDVDYALIFPYIEEVYGHVGVTAGVYVGVGVTVTLQTVQKEGQSAKEAIEGLGAGDLMDTKGYIIEDADKKDTIKELGNLTKFGGELGSVANIAKIGGSEGDGLGISKIPGKKADYWGITDTDDGTEVDGFQDTENTVGGSFEEKYSNFIEGSDAEYVEIFRQEILTFEGHDPTGFIAFSLGLSVFAEFKLNVMLGASLTYEIEKEASVDFTVFKPSKKTHVGDKVEESFQVDLYIFGMVGIRAGVEVEFRIGIISTRIASIGIAVKVGLYAEFYGFFYIAYKWDPLFGSRSEKFGAMRLEIGAFLDVLFRAQIGGGAAQKDVSLYSAKWPILAFGPDYIPIDFVILPLDDDLTLNIEQRTDENKDKESTPTNVIGGASIQVPDELFEIKMLQLSTGSLSMVNMDDTAAIDNKSGSFTSGGITYRQKDERYFHVEFTPKGPGFQEATEEVRKRGGFIYDPVRNTIHAKPADINASDLWGEFTFTFYQHDFRMPDESKLNYGAGFSLNTRVIYRTVKVHWSGTQVKGSAEVYLSNNALENMLETEAPAAMTEADPDDKYNTASFARLTLAFRTVVEGRNLADYFVMHPERIEFDGFDGVSYFMDNRKLAERYPGYKLAFSKEKYSPESIQCYEDRYNDGKSNLGIEFTRFFFYNGNLDKGGQEDGAGWMMVMPEDPYLFYTMVSPETLVRLYFIKGYTETDWYIMNIKANTDEKDRKVDYDNPVVSVFAAELPAGRNPLDHMPDAIRKECDITSDGYDYVWFSYSDKDGLYQNIRLDPNVNGGSRRAINYKANEDRSHKQGVGDKKYIVYHKDYLWTKGAMTCMPCLEEFIDHPDVWETVTEGSLIPPGSTVYFAVRVPKSFQITFCFDDSDSQYICDVRYGSEFPIVYGSRPGYTYKGCYDLFDGTYYDIFHDTMPARDLTLYPVYEGEPIDIAWHYGGATEVTQAKYGDRLLGYCPFVLIRTGTGKETQKIAWSYTGEASEPESRDGNAEERREIRWFRRSNNAYTDMVTDDQTVDGYTTDLYGAAVYTITYMDGETRLDEQQYCGSWGDLLFHIKPIDIQDYVQKPGYDFAWKREDGTVIDDRSIMPEEDFTVYADWKEHTYSYRWILKDQDGNITLLAETPSVSVGKTVGDIRPVDIPKLTDTRYIRTTYRWDHYDGYYYGNGMGVSPDWYISNRTWKKTMNRNALPANDATFIILVSKRMVEVTWKYKNKDLKSNVWVANKLSWPAGTPYTSPDIYDGWNTIVGWHDEEGKVYYDGKAFIYPPYENEHIVLYPDLKEHDHTWLLQEHVDSTCTSHGYKIYKCFCDKTRREELPLLDHEFETTGIKYDATCTKPAAELYKCRYCDETKLVELSPALGHIILEDVIANVINATCTQPGSWDKQTMCSRCGEVFSSTSFTQPALGHSTEEIRENEVPATCTEGGSYDKVVRCKRCGEEFSREKVGTDPEGHYYDVTETKPTCTEKGFTTYICEKCGYSYVDNYTDALGHEYREEVVPPTCTEDGYTLHTCSRCGDSYTDTIVPHGDNTHVAGDPVRTEPYPVMKEDEYGNRWCEKWVAGSIVTKCTKCGAVLSEEVIKVVPKLRKMLGDNNSMALSLDEDLSWCQDMTLAEVNPRNFFCAIATSRNADSEDCIDINDAALSWKDGSKTVSSLFAGDKLVIHIKPQGGDAKTFAENDVTITITGAVAHVHNIVTVEARAATCTEAGWDAYEYCTDCDYTTKVEIPALGHELADVAAKDPTCTEDGWSAYRKCSRCGYTEGYEAKAKLNHDLEDVAAKDPTCTEDGWSAYRKCSRCDYTEGYEVKEKLNHDLEDVVAKDPTCTEDGWSAYRKCSRCDYTEGYEAKAKLNHDLEDVAAQDPTCTQSGWDAYKKCSRCDYTEGFVERPAAHELEEVQEQEAVEGQDGWNAYKKCKHCDYTEGFSVRHMWKNMVGKDPTCKEDGYTDYQECMNCHEKLNYTVLPSDPQYHIWVFDNDMYYCEICGEPQQ